MLNAEDGILLNNGMQTIINAFNRQGEKFQNIINDYEQRIQNLNLENESLKNENNLLKKEIKILTMKLNSISNTISKDNNNLNLSNPILSYKDLSLSNVSNISNHKIPYSKSVKKISRNKLNSNYSFPIMNNYTEEYNQYISNNNSSINVDKYNTINQKIKKMKDDLNINILNQSFENSNLDNFSHNYSNSAFNLSSIRKRVYDGNSENKKNLSKKSIQYQKTSNFLKECKLLLNVQNFEKLIQVFKENENCNTYEIKNKVKGILNGNQKLIEKFENIYN
jgi:hypothetical protein